MYNRRVLAGEVTVVNKHLLRELTALGIWTESVRNHGQWIDSKCQGDSTIDP